MARKKRSKKSKGGTEVVGASPVSMEKRVNTGIEEAENGFVIRVSGEGLGKGKERGYTSKTFVAMDHPSAIRIASEGFSSMAKKVGHGKKKGGKKAAARKRV